MIKKSHDWNFGDSYLCLLKSIRSVKDRDVRAALRSFLHSIDLEVDNLQRLEKKAKWKSNKGVTKKLEQINTSIRFLEEKIFMEVLK